MKREREQILKNQLLKMIYTEEEIDGFMDIINHIYNGLMEEKFGYCAYFFIYLYDANDIRYPCGIDMELNNTYQMMTFSQMKEIHINMRKYLSNLDEGTSDYYEIIKHMEKTLDIEVNRRYKHIMDGTCDLSYRIYEHDIRNYYQNQN